MKRLISVIMVIVLMTCGIVSVTFADDGNGVIAMNESWKIVAGEGLESAAEALAGYINEACGFTPEIVSEPVSPSVRLTIDPEKVTDGYMIESDETNVYITGSSLQLTVNGMYYFVETYVGIKCYTSKLKVCTLDGVTVPKGLSYTYHPVFEYRDTDWLSPKETEYSLFNGFNSAEYRDIPAQLGGTVDYISSFAHSLTNQFCSADKYYDEHPEYFAKYRGIQTKSQLCLTNEDVYKIVHDEVLELLREKHDPNADLQIISLTQHDNIFFCSCPKCRAVDKKYGSHAGTMLEFVNRIARDVKAAGYDNVAIDTFAYRYTRTPPKGIVPEDNVIVRLCSIECCFSHPLDDPDCPANVGFMKDLAGWSEICDRVYIWDYATNYCNFVGLFPNFGTLQRNMQIFKENNVRGVYEEGNYSLDVCDTEFAELRAYLIGRLMRDPYTDFEQARDEFLNAYYGAGGEYIADFLNLVTENAPAKHLSIYEGMKNTLKLTKAQIAQCDALWKSAEEASQGEAHTNVLNSELCWRYWKMENHVSEFAFLTSRKAEKKKLTEDINATGIKRWREMDDVKAFFISLWQSLNQYLYPVVNFVLKVLYSI